MVIMLGDTKLKKIGLSSCTILSIKGAHLI